MHALVPQLREVLQTFLSFGISVCAFTESHFCCLETGWHIIFIISSIWHWFSDLFINKRVSQGWLFKVMVFHEWGSHASPKLAEWMGNMGKEQWMFLRFHFWAETYWAQQVFKINISSVLVTFSAWCSLGARYPQCDLKWEGLFYFDCLADWSQRSCWLLQLSGWLRDNRVHVMASQWWPCWAVLLKPFKTGIGLLLPPSWFRLTFMEHPLCACVLPLSRARQ